MSSISGSLARSLCLSLSLSPSFSFSLPFCFSLHLLIYLYLSQSPASISQQYLPMPILLQSLTISLSPSLSLSRPHTYSSTFSKAHKETPVILFLMKTGTFPLATLISGIYSLHKSEREAWAWWREADLGSEMSKTDMQAYVLIMTMTHTHTHTTINTHTHILTPNPDALPCFMSYVCFCACRSALGLEHSVHPRPGHSRQHMGPILR